MGGVPPYTGNVPVYMKIHFRELTKLSPTVISTVLKLVEETGELSREIQLFNASEKQENLPALLGELMDVAQTTATLTFVLAHEEKVDIYKAMAAHLQKLSDKGYIKDRHDGVGGVAMKNDGHLVLFLPKLDIKPDMTQTFLKLTEEAGELVQIIGKKSGLSGETRNLLDDEQKEAEVSLALLDVAQCCVTMLYIMAEEYNVNVDGLMKAHEMKLRKRGYL